MRLAAYAIACDRGFAALCVYVCLSVCVCVSKYGTDLHEEEEGGKAEEENVV